MPKRKEIKSVLIIGSGPIIIGQACEFDYSGTQSVRSLKEEGIEVILINSNPATIMTDPTFADHVYLLPLELKSLEYILEKHPNIDSVLPTMGGQTALNLAVEANDKDLWNKYNVEMIGVDIDAINLTEDREQFRAFLDQHEVSYAPCKIANSFLQGKSIAQEFGFPLVIRPSFTLGGTGGSVVYDREVFDDALSRGLEASPIHEVLIDKGLMGWKEYELELLRDQHNNVSVICVIENMDPMGIHTGDSITVAPAMTLSDKTYQKIRDYAIKMMRKLGNFAGGCNVQFAVSPDENEDIVVIEINPRVSRSSALASKATGYPIAKVATKLALGYTLDELENQITKNTSAFFEPVQDYVIVKIPRWNFDKFEGSDRTLGFQMKSVGEVMGIGRNFPEALQKAAQSLEISRNGLGADGKHLQSQQDILEQLATPSWNRLFVIYDAIKFGISIDRIFKETKIDKWYLNQIKLIYDLELQLTKLTLETIDFETMLRAKQMGFSDRQIAHILNVLESEVFSKRQSLGVKRVFKLVDTCSAEFVSKTPYLYSSFERPYHDKNGSLIYKNESNVSDKKKVIVLGSGPNRIGQGIEFDYSCVHGILAAKEAGYETIMINCNPETVSTDFDIADKLYFEPVFWEHIYEIILHEKPEGVIVQLGGQTALKLAEKLDKYGINIIGTSFENMDLAEDRGRFSELLKKLDIPYPKFGVIESSAEAEKLADELDFPILVRPSYVLGGQGMKIVINKEELEEHVVNLLHQIPNNRILLDHYLDGAIEMEADAISDGEDAYIIGTMEHVEPCGVHSGDSHALLPTFSVGDLILKQIEDHTKKIAKALRVKGVINIQFAVKDEKVYVIEANPRASRTVPFIAKAYGERYVNYATKLMLGTHKLSDFKFEPQLDGYAIKEPVFSFNKFPKMNKSLGPEMKSTGEKIAFIDTLDDELFQEIYSRRSMYLSR